MSFVERIIRIITVKRWAKAKRQEADHKLVFEKKEDNSRSSSDYGSGGSVVGFFIGAMIAVVIALQITWPVVDSIINIDMGNNSTMQMGESAKTLLNLIPLFLAITVCLVFIRPLID